MGASFQRRSGFVKRWRDNGLSRELEMSPEEEWWTYQALDIELTSVTGQCRGSRLSRP